MIFDIVVVGPLGVNCVILGCDKTGKALIIDPGGDADLILAAVGKHNLSVSGIVNTHGHFDHVGANRRIKEATGAPLMIHKDDEPMLYRVAAIAGMYGMTGEDSPAPDSFLEDGMTIPFGNCSLKLIHTPGHTPGGCCLYVEEANKIITGDTLFADGIGRTDLPGGSTSQLIASIKNRLFVLPEDLHAYPGHGPSTTIGHEKHHNPYLD